METQYGAAGPVARFDETALTDGGFVVESECGILVPCCVVKYPRTPADAPLVAYLARDGKDAVFFERRARELLDSGFRLLGIDVRGTGETCFVYYTEEEAAVENSVITGRSLLAGRAFDLSAVLEVLEREGLLPSPAGAWVTDSFSLYALPAAAGDERIAAVLAEKTILSLVSDEGFNERGIEALFVPGILKHADLPQLFGLCAPKRLALVNPVGPRGRRLEKAAAEKALEWTAAAYSSAGASGDFTLETGMADSDARRFAVEFFGG